MAGMGFGMRLKKRVECLEKDKDKNKDKKIVGFDLVQFSVPSVDLNGKRVEFLEYQETYDEHGNWTGGKEIPTFASRTVNAKDVLIALLGHLNLEVVCVQSGQWGDYKVKVRPIPVQRTKK